MKKILTTLIATTALLTLSAPASSAEITGCLDVRGTLTKVAPGVQPMRPCGPQAKKVRIPVASGAGKPGSARVDSYTFWKEIDSVDSNVFGVDGEEVVMARGRSYPVGFWAGCVQRQEGDGRLVTAAWILPTSDYVIRGEGMGVLSHEEPIEVARERRVFQPRSCRNP